jgi:hypothetical protein
MILTRFFRSIKYRRLQASALLPDRGQAGQHPLHPGRPVMQRSDRGIQFEACVPLTLGRPVIPRLDRGIQLEACVPRTLGSLSYRGLTAVSSSKRLSPAPWTPRSSRGVTTSAGIPACAACRPAKPTKPVIPRPDHGIQLEANIPCRWTPRSSRGVTTPASIPACAACRPTGPTKPVVS